MSSTTPDWNNPVSHMSTHRTGLPKHQVIHSHYNQPQWPTHHQKALPASVGMCLLVKCRDYWICLLHFPWMGSWPWSRPGLTSCTTRGRLVSLARPYRNWLQDSPRRSIAMGEMSTLAVIDVGLDNWLALGRFGAVIEEKAFRKVLDSFLWMG